MYLTHLGQLNRSLIYSNNRDNVPSLAEINTLWAKKVFENALEETLPITSLEHIHSNILFVFINKYYNVIIYYKLLFIYSHYNYDII